MGMSWMKKTTLPLLVQLPEGKQTPQSYVGYCYFGFFAFNIGVVCRNSCWPSFFLHLLNTTEVTCQASHLFGPLLLSDLHSQSHLDPRWQKAISRRKRKYIHKYREPCTLSHSQCSISGFWSSKAILAESPQRSYNRADTPWCALLPALPLLGVTSRKHLLGFCQVLSQPPQE